MMRKGILIAVILALSPLYTHSEVSQELVKGRILFSITERLHFTVGDLIRINLGEKEGLIKGDMVVLGEEWQGLVNASGKCVVTMVDEKGSLCEIVRASREIGREDMVFARPLRGRDSKLYPLVYSLLSRIMVPYAPHEKPRVWVQDILDQDGNVTEFSRRVMGEILNGLAQKGQIRLRQEGAREQTAIEEILGREVDVIVTGIYTSYADKLEIKLLKYDARRGKETLTYQISLDGERAEISKILVPFTEPEKRFYVGLKIVFVHRGFSPKAMQKRELVALESEGDPFLKRYLSSVGFNVVAPKDVRCSIDGKEIPLDQGNSTELRLASGTHRLAISFKRGYFQDSKDVCVFTSAREVKKEIVLSLEKDGQYTVIVTLDASFVKEPINVGVKRETQREKIVIKEVVEEGSEVPVELFK